MEISHLIYRGLKRLLLVHGNRSYARITRLVMYSFCKVISGPQKAPEKVECTTIAHETT